MNVGSVTRSYEYQQTHTSSKKQNIKKSTVKKDTIEISSKAYEKQEQTEYISATSGKDILGITKGSKKNTYLVHFSDSAMVSRAISRGYITVNGVNIELSNETKEQLATIDKEAEDDRMQAYYKYITEHELAVAKQQSETMKKLFSDASKAFQIASKLAHGGKISPEEAEILMGYNPQLYIMAMSSGSIEKRNDTHENAKKEEATSGVSWSQFEWKTYETDMTVSLENEAQILEINEGEVVLNSGE